MASISVPIWILVLAALGNLALLIYLFIFRDTGSSIFPLKDEETLHTFIQALRVTTGISPAMDGSSANVVRALYSNGLIVNTSDAETLRKLNLASSAIAFVSKDPIWAANQFAGHLRNHGFKDVVVEIDFDKSLDPGKMVAVLSPDFNGKAVIFRVHKMKMQKGKPPAWKRS